MRGIIGRVTYLKALLSRYDPYETLGVVIEGELGIRDWQELVDPAKALADEHCAIYDHVEGRQGEGR